jgi:hypothetical protein
MKQCMLESTKRTHHEGSGRAFGRLNCKKGMLLSHDRYLTFIAEFNFNQAEAALWRKGVSIAGKGYILVHGIMMGKHTA